MNRAREAPTVRRAWLWGAGAVALLFVLAALYSSLAPSTYKSSVRIAPFATNPDAFLREPPVPVATLRAYAAEVKSPIVAVAAAHRLPPSFPDNDSDRNALAAARTRIAAKVDRKTRQVIITASGDAPSDAALRANAYAQSLLNVRASRAANEANAAIAAATRKLGKRGSAADLQRAIAPLIPPLQVQVIHPAKARGVPVVTTAIAVAIALVALLALLTLTGAWRPRSAPS